MSSDWARTYHLKELEAATGVSWVPTRQLSELNERQLLHVLEEVRIEASWRGRVSALLTVLTLGLAALFTYGVVFGSLAGILTGSIIGLPMAVLTYLHAERSLRPARLRVRKTSAAYQDRILDGAE